MARTLVGVFHTRDNATKVVEALKVMGYRPEDISVIVKDRSEIRSIEKAAGTKVNEGLATGAVTGGMLGGLTGLLVGIGALTIPGIGPIVAAGPIATTLGGAALGASALGLMGALIGMGIPENEARDYEKHVKNGDILVLVNAHDQQARQIMQTFRDHGTLNENYYNDNLSEGGSAAERAYDEHPYDPQRPLN
ncbi:general stress protein [Aneurinibacillus sp. REN35]|uniref:general stress protein n=1 Tax=Aneurinibacillus sp. REN35 TaxID=3237286 RepID=UPI0035280FD3